MSKADGEEAARRRRSVRMYVRHAAPLASFVGIVSATCIQGAPGTRKENTRAIRVTVRPEVPTPAGEWDPVTYAHQGEVSVVVAEGDDDVPWGSIDMGQRVVVMVAPIAPEAPWRRPGDAPAKRAVDRWAEDVFACALRDVLDPATDPGAVGRSPHGLFRGLLHSVGELAVYAEPNSARSVVEGLLRMSMRMAKLGESGERRSGSSSWHKRFRSGLMTTLDDARRAGVGALLPAELFAALAMDVGQIGCELASHPEGQEAAAVVGRIWHLLLRCCAGALAIARRAEAGLEVGA